MAGPAAEQGRPAAARALSASVGDLLVEMGFPPEAVDSVLRDLVRGELSPRAAASALEQEHPLGEGLRERVPVTSSRDAGTYRLSAGRTGWAQPGGLQSAATTDDSPPAPQEPQGDGAPADSDFPRAWSAPAAHGGSMPVWRRLCDAVRDPAAAASRVLSPRRAAHCGVPPALRPRAAWVIPAHLALVLLRVAAVCAGSSGDLSSIGSLVAAGRLQDPELTRLLRDAERSGGPGPAAVPAEPEVDCMICYCPYPRSQMVPSGCPEQHEFCSDCMAAHCESTALPLCPAAGCRYPLCEGDVKAACGDGPQLRRFREAQLAATIDALPGLLRCPGERCQNAVVVDPGAGRMRWRCLECGHPPVCTACRELYHCQLECAEVPRVRMQWLEWRASGRAKHEGGKKGAGRGGAAAREAAAEYEAALARHRQLVADEGYKVQNCRLCPFCKRLCEKTMGCPSMTCGRDAPDKGGGNVQQGCGRRFDWSDATPYVPHFTDAEFARLPQAPAGKGRKQKAVHPGVKCSLCGSCPIVGPRFECVHCDAFDVCGECEKARLGQGKAHPREHVFRIHFEGPPEAAAAAGTPPAGDGQRAARLMALQLQQRAERQLQQGAARRGQRHAALLQRERRARLGILGALCFIVCLAVVQCLVVSRWSLFDMPERVTCTGEAAQLCECGGWGTERALVPKAIASDGAAVAFTDASGRRLSWAVADGRLLLSGGDIPAPTPVTGLEYVNETASVEASLGSGGRTVAPLRQTGRLLEILGALRAMADAVQLPSADLPEFVDRTEEQVGLATTWLARALSWAGSSIALAVCCASAGVYAYCVSPRSAPVGQGLGVLSGVFAFVGVAPILCSLIGWILHDALWAALSAGAVCVFRPRPAYYRRRHPRDIAFRGIPAAFAAFLGAIIYVVLPWLTGDPSWRSPPLIGTLLTLGGWLESRTLLTLLYLAWVWFAILRMSRSDWSPRTCWQMIVLTIASAPTYYLLGLFIELFWPEVPPAFEVGPGLTFAGVDVGECRMLSCPARRTVSMFLSAGAITNAGGTAVELLRVAAGTSVAAMAAFVCVAIGRVLGHDPVHASATRRKVAYAGFCLVPAANAVAIACTLQMQSAALCGGDFTLQHVASGNRVPVAFAVIGLLCSIVMAGITFN